MNPARRPSERPECGPVRQARRLGGVLSFVVALTMGAPAEAHDETVSASDVQIHERDLVWKVDVGVAGLAKALRLSLAPGGGEGVSFTEAELATHKDAIARYLQSGLEVQIDGRRVLAEVGALEPRYEATGAAAPSLARVALELRYASGRGTIEEVRAQVRFFAELTSQHRAVMKVRWGREVRQLSRLGPAEIVLERGRLNPTRWTVMRDFVMWGAHHIFIGYDHIAFLLALLLAVARLSELLKIVTSFTVAHSVTILLSAFDLVHLPGRITEALIAASIVYVAVENLVRSGEGGGRRWLLTFGFGLVHGLGFAEVLRERLAEVPGGIVLPVVSFNVGVEIGQVAIVAAVFPLLLWVRRAGHEGARRARQHRLVRLGSIPILVLGIFWLGERLMP